MIIAMDPGTDESGLVAWDGAKLIYKATPTNEAIIEEILPLWIKDTQTLVIEDIVYANDAGRELFTTVRWTGRFEQEWLRRGGQTIYIPRATVKAHVCGKAHVKDGNVWFALKERFAGGQKVTKGSILWKLGEHERQALALAVTYWDREIGPENPFA
jgi:hypothetical protein